MQLQPPVEERSPSPINLCTKLSNDQKKIMRHLKGNRPQLEYLRIPMITVDLGNLEE